MTEATHVIEAIHVLPDGSAIWAGRLTVTTAYTLDTGLKQVEGIGLSVQGQGTAGVIGVSQIVAFIASLITNSYGDFGGVISFALGKFSGSTTAGLQTTARTASVWLVVVGEP